MKALLNDAAYSLLGTVIAKIHCNIIHNKTKPVVCPRAIMYIYTYAFTFIYIDNCINAQPLHPPIRAMFYQLDVGCV